MALPQTAAGIATAIASGETSAVDICSESLRRIESVEPCIGALITVAREQALLAARRIDATPLDRRANKPLLGVPIVVKDNISTRGLRTSCGSRMLATYEPPYDATVISRLRQAGAIIIAKSNLDEFAMGSSTENSAFGPTRNPWDVSCVPGGSSGGSAAAVAAREVPLALGSDTGGSVRQPAALCGVVGLKPTYGRVSRYGLVAYASSLDQIGPMALTVHDASIAFEVIAGSDPNDLTTSAGRRWTPSPDQDITGLRIGVPIEYFSNGVDPEVSSAVRTAIDTLCRLGAVAEECSLPMTAYALSAYYVIAPAEASSNLARYDGVRYGTRPTMHGATSGLQERTRAAGFGPEVMHRIMVGTYALSAGYYEAYYRRALQVRTLIQREFDAVFERFDVLACPSSPVTAFKLGDRSHDPIKMKLADTCTIPANLAGLPALSLPCGFASGLPVGLQLIAPAFQESRIFRTALAYESVSPWHTYRPRVCAE